MESIDANPRQMRQTVRPKPQIPQRHLKSRRQTSQNQSSLPTVTPETIDPTSNSSSSIRCDLQFIAQAHYDRAGRPRLDEAPSRISYSVQATLAPNPEVIEVEMTRAGRFILATNVLDAHQLSADDALTEYKDQQSNERGFRFLKDPLFFTSSVFVKSPKRVEALVMVMGLCLLVYSLAQRQL